MRLTITGRQNASPPPKSCTELCSFCLFEASAGPNHPTLVERRSSRFARSEPGEQSSVIGSLHQRLEAFGGPPTSSEIGVLRYLGAGEARKQKAMKAVGNIHRSPTACHSRSRHSRHSHHSHSQGQLPRPWQSRRTQGQKTLHELWRLIYVKHVIYGHSAPASAAGPKLKAATTNARLGQRHCTGKTR